MPPQVGFFVPPAVPGFSSIFGAMQNWQGKIAWITGASSGIGEEMARQLNAAGASVVLSARRKEILKEIAAKLPHPENSLVLPLDMECPEQFPAAVNQVLEKYARLDLLFNNAGISQRSYAADTADVVDRRLMEINYFGTITLTKALLPQFRKQHGGHIAVTSSLAGKFGFYQRSAYAASKFALHGFFETLRLEEEEHNLKVTMLCPSGIKTAISQNALSGQGEKFGQSSALQEQGLAVEECVKRMIEAIEKEKTEVIIGQGMEALSVKIKALFPDFFLKMLRKKKP